MLFRLLALFMLVPVVELAILLKVGDYIGVWNTVLLILFTGGVGVALARSQGSAVFRQFREDIQMGRVPGITIVSGILVLIGSAFLITPGLVTDTVGFLLLIPQSRNYMVRLLRDYIRRKINAGDFVFWIRR